MITTYDDLISHVQARTHEGRHILLSFSGGKDAWGTWLATRDHFEITPFYYYMIPHLEFIDDYLARCEKRMGCRIRQYPHPMLYDMLTSCTMQAPQRIWALEHMDLPRFKMDFLNRCAEADAGFPKNSCYVALGLRAADSIMRGTYFKTHGPVDDKNKKFSPIWNWKKDRLVAALKKEGIKLSKEYEWFGRSFDGPVLLYSWNLKKYAPKDYARLLEWFPMLESEVWRYERFLENGGKKNAE